MNFSKAVRVLKLQQKNDMMRGALIETEARRILNKGMNEAQKETALRMLKRGKMTIQEIAEDTGLNEAEVERLAGFQTV